MAVAGLFGSILIPVAAVFLAALLGVARFDLHNFSGYASSLKTLLPASKALPMPINSLIAIGCLAYGILIGWLRIRAGNIWPSVIAHGGFNAAGGFYLSVVAAGTTPNLIAIDPLGWSARILVGGLILVLVLARQIPKNNVWPSHTDQTLSLPGGSSEG